MVSPLSSARGCRPQPGREAFTMIEVIGVLTVLAVVAAIALTALPRHIDVLATGLERTNLVNYATALQNSVLRNRLIPGAGTPNDITNVIAMELGMDVKDVTINLRGNTRAFLFNPNFQFYTNKDLIDSGHLVTVGPMSWQQNIGGA